RRGVRIELGAAVQRVEPHAVTLSDGRTLDAFTIVWTAGVTPGRLVLELPLLHHRDATVTVCHTKTPDLTTALAPCDIVMVAAGKAGLVKGEHLREGQVVIDAGINVVGDKLVGDVEEASARGKVKALTPVPGGVGTLTTAIIFRNLLRAIR